MIGSNDPFLALNQSLCWGIWTNQNASYLFQLYPADVPFITALIYYPSLQSHVMSHNQFHVHPKAACGHHLVNKVLYRPTFHKQLPLQIISTWQRMHLLNIMGLPIAYYPMISNTCFALRCFALCYDQWWIDFYSCIKLVRYICICTYLLSFW